MQVCYFVVLYKVSEAESAQDEMRSYIKLLGFVMTRMGYLSCIFNFDVMI